MCCLSALLVVECGAPMAATKAMPRRAPLADPPVTRDAHHGGDCVVLLMWGLHLAHAKEAPRAMRRGAALRGPEECSEASVGGQAAHHPVAPREGMPSQRGC